MDQRSSGESTWRQTFWSDWHRYVPIWQFTGAGIIIDAEHMADDGLCLRVGLFPVLHRRMAFHYLLSGVQRAIRVILGEQTARLDYLLPLPDLGHLH